jgi:hypothetical protein
MDEKELEAVSAALDELRKGGTLSAETLAKLGGTTQNTNKVLEGYTKKVLGATSAIGGMAKQVADGEGSFRSLGGTIVGLTSVVGKLASAIPLVGGAAKALAEGVGEAAKFVLDQLDVMAKNYQTLGDASAGAADGVDGLLRQFNQMGNYSLPAFTKAVRANTQGLAALSGTAALGAEELSKVSGALTTGDTARRFLRLGISLDAVGDATAQYLADSARYGITQGMTTDELTKKTQNYIVEVDKIARLTGQTREAQAKEAQKSLVDARFRAKLAEMASSGQAAQADELRKYVEGLGGAAGDAARALVTGIPLSKEAAAANLFANDAIRQNTIAVQEGRMATEAITDTQEALARGTETFSKQVQYGGDMFGGVYIQAADTAAMLKVQNKLMSEGMTREQAVAEAQRRQMEASGKTTTEFTDAQLATAGASKNLQSLGFSLATYAIPAVDKFAGALEKITGFINKNLGVGGTASTPPGVNRGASGGPRAAGGGGVSVVPGTSVTVGGETRTGGDRNWRNNNPGNIEYGPFAMQYGAIGSDGRFAIFPSEEHGRKAQDALLKSKNYASLSLADAIKRYAPSNENDPKSYANQIMKSTGVDLGSRYTDLSADQQGKVLDAMRRIEGGRSGTISGPSGPYQNSLNGINPTSAGIETKQQGAQTSQEQQQSNNSVMLARQMAELNQTQKDLLAVNKKILQRQS